jgi:ABC-2 type transport system permease protein
MASSRFRDLNPIVGSVVQLMFFLTPIVWIYEDFLHSPNPSIAERARLAELNPFLHFIEMIRRPMLGEPQVWHHWAVVLGITVVGWAITLVALRRYRSRVSYWV